MFIYFWERESESREGTEKEGDTESEAGSRLPAVSTEPDAGLELTTREITTWAEVDAQWTEPPRCPKCLFIFKRERGRAQVEEGQRRRHPRHNLKGSRLQAINPEPNVVLKLTNHEIMAWATVWCSTDWITQAPLYYLIFKLLLVIIY